MLLDTPSSLIAKKFFAPNVPAARVRLRRKEGFSGAKFPENEVLSSSVGGSRTSPLGARVWHSRQSAINMLNIFAIFVQRRLYHWVFEVLPLCLLAFQSIAAVTAQGNVDGWSRQAVGAARDLGRNMGKAGGQLANFIGRWNIQERHNMDEFLEQLGFTAWQRALITRAGQQTTMEATGGNLSIITSDLRGTTRLDLPLDGAERESCAPPFAPPPPF